MCRERMGADVCVRVSVMVSVSLCHGYQTAAAGSNSG